MRQQPMMTLSNTMLLGVSFLQFECEKQPLQVTRLQPADLTDRMHGIWLRITDCFDPVNELGEDSFKVRCHSRGLAILIASPFDEGMFVRINFVGQIRSFLQRKFKRNVVCTHNRRVSVFGTTRDKDWCFDLQE